ncbi:MAG: cytidylate kinase family protein [Candidatus Diapherotrites archaeon]|uniref:Cytidylate kinase family protein n=1 Tax=Candidatus Iainarchaeum sp. TaxID=3101447 RepID=A0A8T4LJK5_9ARCH|nr:cytidylate kinase family protein [Candidatus Diapherotrites archaeon]
MIVIVSGFAGSGKSTLAERLAKKQGLKCVHASGLLRQLQERTASELKADEAKANTGWWESREGKAYLERRLKDSSMDQALDAELLRIAKAGDVVLDSWTMPWLFKGNAFKVWLKTSLDVRAKRVAGRDKLDEKEVQAKLAERDEKTATIYRKIYGFELGKDLKPFSLVLDTDKLNEKQVFEACVDALEKWLKTQRFVC